MSPSKTSSRNATRSAGHLVFKQRDNGYSQRSRGIFRNTLWNYITRIKSAFSQCVMHSSTASVTALISSNRQGKWRKQTVLGGLVTFKNNSSRHVCHTHHVLRHALCVCLLPRGIRIPSVAQTRRQRLRGRRSFVAVYTTVES